MITFDSPIAAFEHWEATAPDNIFLRQPFNRVLKDYTFKEAGNEVRSMAAALRALDLPANSHVALLSKNCAHWIMADLAIMMAGHVSIPIYPTLNAESIRQILEHSESKAIIIGKLDKYEDQKSGIPDIHKIGVKAYDIDEETSWEDLVEQNEPLQDINKPDNDDLVTIIYTSGTTGVPKGVMHTYGNFTIYLNTASEVLNFPENPRFFSFLPLAHVAERLAVGHGGVFRGATVSFPESLATFAEDLELTMPHFLFAVPRIWSKFQEKILEKMPQKKLNTLLGIPILGGIVKKKIVKKLGLTEARYMCSGAAPIAQSLQEWFEKLGIIVHQDYGMTEDCILSHYNLPGANKFGTVGKALPGVTGKLSPAGEICVKSDVLMKGYFKEPELTAEMFDEEGFLKTGDIGEYDHDGYLTITGRVKDQFKTDKGKYVSPAPIELELLKNENIEQICLVGMGIPQTIALVIPSFISKNISKEEFNSSLMKSVQELNQKIETYERIKKVVIMKEDWSVDNGLLTPTLKVKRNQVEKIHMPMYKEWFAMEEQVIYE
jgi:long-chain acyl-CoA synthetase